MTARLAPALLNIGPDTPMATQEPKTSSILIVDDDPAVITALGRALSRLGRVSFATSGRDGLRLAREMSPDLVLLDMEMADLSGREVCNELKADPRLAEVPVIFITGHDSLEEEVAGLSLGAADFIAKPPHMPIVIARVQTQLRMKQMSDELRRLARTDGLTGLSNRHELDAALRKEASRAMRTHAPLSLLLLDVDHFKAYNDTYGHPAGDGCLRAVAKAIRSAVHRPADVIGRYGGEEFAVLLPETEAVGAASVAEHIIQAVDALKVPHARSSVGPHLSVSIGVATVDAAVFDPRQGGDPLTRALVDAADRGLYVAKARGRHCTASVDPAVAFDPPAVTPFLDAHG